MVKSKKPEEKGNRESLLRDSSRKKLARSPGPCGEMQKQTPEAPVLKEMLLVDSVITSFPGIFFLFDEQGHLLHWNRNTETVSGYAPEDITGMSPLDLFEGEEKELIAKRIGEAFLQGESEAKAHLITKDGKKVPYYFTARRFVSRDRKYLVGMGIDISERKKAEAVLRNEQQWRLTFFNAVPNPIFLLDPDGRIIRHNQATAALAGKPGSDVLGRYCCEVVHGSSAPIENCPFIRVKRSKRKEELVLETDGRWLQLIVHPVLDDDGNLIGAVHNIEDITEHRQAEQRVAETLNRLRGALGGIIQVISATVETRDPYTAGHQKRVANLAQAIAREMGLSADRVDGLRTAGIIHDLGKVSIPAEILSKPTKLSEIEYKIIQVHPQTGHDILIDIDFPWPLAEMILQHHERINGSGYPKGLKGEDILLEARILAVADVVEAIASHRPYRPGHGIETALLEIEKNSGILYDPAAADTCLKLFREKGFRLDLDAYPVEDKMLSDGPSASCQATRIHG